MAHDDLRRRDGRAQECILHPARTGPFSPYQSPPPCFLCAHPPARVRVDEEICAFMRVRARASVRTNGALFIVLRRVACANGSVRAIGYVRVRQCGVCVCVCVWLVCRGRTLCGRVGRAGPHSATPSLTGTRAIQSTSTLLRCACSLSLPSLPLSSSPLSPPFPSHRFLLLSSSLGSTLPPPVSI